MNFNWREHGRTLLGNLLLALACGLSARAAQVLFGTINERVIIFWPPVGLALGAVLIGGPRFIWGAFLGLVVNGVEYGFTLGISMAIALGDATEVLLAYWFLTRDPTFDRSFSKGRDYLFLFSVAALCAAIGTCIGVGSVLATGRFPWTAAPQVWIRWWMGDQLGILLVVPAFLIWWQRPFGWLRRERRWEFLLYLGLAFLVGQALFMGWMPTPLAPYAKGYLAFLYVTWASVRYGRHGVTLVLLLVMGQALGGAALGVGYFATDNAQTHLTNFWFFMVTLTVVQVALASVIRERERAEEIAREEASFKDQMLAGVPGGLLVFGTGGRIIFANDRAESILGLTAEQLQRVTSEDPPWRLVEEDLTPIPKEAYPVKLVTVSRKPIENRVLGLVKPGAIEPAWMLVTAFPELRPDGSLGKVVVMFVDISERKAEEQERRRLEAILQHSQKMESLGTLSGGIAHDMNNVLGGIMMIASTLREVHEGEKDLTGHLDTLLAASERGRNLVKGLLGFTRQELGQSQPVDLNELLGLEMGILRHTTRQKVEVVGNLTPKLPKILGEPSTLGAALMNLSVNALDAMEDGGILTFGTRALPDGRVELTVEDTGCGMSPEVLSRAFDPFFTTKPVGKGTGLGLSLLHATLKAHRATIDIQSEPGKGTRFTMRFPPLPPELAEVDPPQGLALASEPHQPETGTQPLVLLVDDDDLIRKAMPSLLQAMGYQTEALTNGEACLARLQSGIPPDVIILDHNMPGLTGMETLRRMRAQGSRIPVILASGFLETNQEKELLQTPFVWILRKPYALRDFNPVFAEILGAGKMP